MPERPYQKKKQQKTSIWTIVESEQDFERMVSRPIFTPLRDLGLDGWTHWPSPYNFQAHITQLACEPTWQAKVELYATGFAWWFWSNLVPSPVELTRKLFLGGYKCGFYLPIRFKSPLTFFIGQGGVTFLAELIRPVTTFFFYWWLASSLFAALDTYHTVQMLEDECQNEGFFTLLGGAETSVNSSGDYEGVGMQVLSDPFGRHVTASGVDVHNTVWTYDTFAYFNPMGNHVDSIVVEIRIGTVVYSTSLLNAPTGDQDLAITVSAKNVAGDPPEIVYAVMHINGFGPWNGTYAKAKFGRVTVHGIPIPP